MSTYRWKTKPYRHQVSAVKSLLRRDFGGALLMEPRTGKTKTSVDYLSILCQQKKVDFVVIVCPARVMGVWVNELQQHSNARMHITVWDAKARRRGIPDVHPYYDLHVLITNYEAFSTPGRKLPSGRRSKSTGRFKVRSMIRQWLMNSKHGRLCILDESHKIKSPSGKAANMIVSMRPFFNYRLILTGTPVTKASRIHDLWMQWQFLNPQRFAGIAGNVADFKMFTGRWINDNGFPQWVGERRAGVREVQRLIHEDSFAIKRDDCFDLPPRDIEVIRVPLKESGKAYDDMATKMVHQLESGEIAEASIVLVQILRLAQITGGNIGFSEDYLDDNGKARKRKWSRRIGREKLTVLKELLNDYKERDEKVVIAARFIADMDAIAALCVELDIPVWQLRGGIKRAEADENIQSFRDHTDSCAVFLMQPASGSLGIDLSTASRMVWFSLTPSWVDYTQGCDRIALSRTSTTFTYLLAENTVDELLYETLNTDGMVAKAVLDNPHRLERKQ